MRGRQSHSYRRCGWGYGRGFNPMWLIGAGVLLFLFVGGLRWAWWLIFPLMWFVFPAIFGGWHRHEGGALGEWEKRKHDDFDGEKPKRNGSPRYVITGDGERMEVVEAPDARKDDEYI